MLKQVLRVPPPFRWTLLGPPSRRTFLSDAFPCRDSWQSRLTTPILAKVNHEALYYELEQKFQQKAKVSAIDIDIYANKLVDDTHIDEVADLMYKFRLTEETSRGLPSTQHAIARTYIEHSHYAELIEMLDNRIGYGVFLDDFTANLALDRLVTTNEFKWGARIATLLALQEDFTNPITRALSTYACYRYVKGGEIDHFDDLAPPPPPEEGEVKKKKKDEIKVRVKFLRNPYFDDHFDLRDSKQLLGKTFFILGLNSEHAVVANSCKLLGLVLNGKYDSAVELIEAAKGGEVSGEIVELAKGYLDKVENQDDESYRKLVDAMQSAGSVLKVSSDSFEKVLLDAINKSVAEHEKPQIEAQKKIYTEWCELRQQRLDEEMTRLQRARRIQELERVSREMEQEEQKLWFFENEDKIELEIDSKKVFYPKRWFGKKKKPRVIDEGYVPPEVRQRQGQQ
uniref:Putative mitochondrial 28s ribosomal protein s27 n=1 Tax=Culex tarsalis TaxID=7177 RepID=A0A1Q3F805_CULTA